MKNKALTRKEREYQQRRQEILQAALHLFSKKGYHDVSMTKIAQESEFSVGTLYNFFPNKEAIYMALLQEKCSEIFERVHAAINKTKSVTEKIRTLVEEHIRVFDENTEFLRLYLSETKGMDHSALKHNIQEEFKNEFDKMHTAVVKIFKKGIEKKLFKNYDPDFLVVSLFGMCDSLMLENFKNPGKLKIDADTILNVFFHQVYEKGVNENG